MYYNEIMPQQTVYKFPQINPHQIPITSSFEKLDQNRQQLMQMLSTSEGE